MFYNKIIGFIFIFCLVFVSNAYSWTKPRCLLNIYIKSNHTILFNGKSVDVNQVKDSVKAFVQNPKNEMDKSDKREKDIEHLGKMQVTKALVSIQCKRNTTYGFYVRVSNEIEKAYNELRQELAQQQFNKPYNMLEDKYKKAINACYPKRISEAEPNFILVQGDLVKNNLCFYY
jgi:biopolymer transport protein ExbD